MQCLSVDVSSKEQVVGKLVTLPHERWRLRDRGKGAFMIWSEDITALVDFLN